MATGGDGYPNFASRMTTQDIMEQVVADYITAHSPLTPVVKAAPNGRINCTDSNGASGAELSDADRVPVTTQGLGGPPRPAVGHPQPDATSATSAAQPPTRRPRASRDLSCRRRAERGRGSRGCR